MVDEEDLEGEILDLAKSIKGSLFQMKNGHLVFGGIDNGLLVVRLCDILIGCQVRLMSNFIGFESNQGDYEQIKTQNKFSRIIDPTFSWLRRSLLWSLENYIDYSDFKGGYQVDLLVNKWYGLINGDCTVVKYISCQKFDLDVNIDCIRSSQFNFEYLYRVGYRT